MNLICCFLRRHFNNVKLDERARKIYIPEGNTVVDLKTDKVILIIQFYFSMLANLNIPYFTNTG